MAKKTRNKAYKPKGVMPNCMDWAIAGAHTLLLGQQEAFIKPVDDALDLLRQGVATRDDWNMVASAMNIAVALADLQICPNFVPDFERAQEALREIAGRMIQRGTSTCYAAELEALREARDLYRIQLRYCTQAESSRAIKRVKDTHRSGGMQDMAKLFHSMPAAAGMQLQQA